MIEQIMNLLGWTNGQINRFWEFVTAAKNLTASGFSFKRFFSGVLAVIELFCAAAFKTPIHPYGQKLDLTGYNLVFCDDFDDDELNTDIWFTRADGPRRCGFNAPSQVKQKNGNLIITGEYLTDGTYGEGWYAGAIALKQKYTKGYFEIRCICNDSTDFWSAFWFQGTNPYDAEFSRGGVGSAEIDIFESYSSVNPKLKYELNTVSQTIWCNGYDDDADSLDKCAISALGNDIRHQFNTYGVEWNDDEYIFYINGVETGRTSFGNGTSNDTEELIVSLEIPETEINLDKSVKTELIVDYVKAWQK